MMIRRRFVNIVVENYRSGMYSLHRLDVSKHLFYPSTAEAQVLSAGPEALANIGGRGDAPPVTDRLPELPAPCMSFNPSPTNNWSNPRLAFFGLVSPRCSEGKVLCIDRAGHALLYDADSHSTIPMPTLKHPKGISPVAVSVPRPGAKEEDLYIMHHVPEPGYPCFDVLTRLDFPGNATWQNLPQPPFTRDPRYEPNFIRSYTVVDQGRTICISSGADGIGTYCFDTVESKWKHAGDWVLPFHGRAEYIPELKLWLGFSLGRSHYLCGTSVLSSMAMDRPPKLQCVWRDLDVPEKWLATRIDLINLGAGRFCIVKVFGVDHYTPGGLDDDWDVVESELAVLTGIEICSNGADQDSNHHLCAMSGLSAMVNQPPVLHQVWQDQMPKEWMATRVSIVNLGAGRFCIAKVFKVAPNTSAEEKAGYFSDWGVADDDEFVVLTGLEIHCSHDDNNLLQWLQSFKHKSIRYMCTSNSIHCVL